MLDHFLPYALVNPTNPVFRFDLRRKRWPRSQDDLKRFSRNLIFGCLLLFGLYCAAMLGNQGRYGLSTRTTSITMLLILLATVAITLASDFYSAIVTVGGLNHQFHSGEWDLLRLTGQDEEEIFKAKQAVAQIQAWRMMSVETAIHAIGAELLIMSALYSWFSYQYRRADWVDIYLILATSVLMVFYVFEPFWRMRAIVALGMAVSAQTRSLTFGVLGVLGAIFAMRLLQAVFFGVLFYTLTLLARKVSGDLGNASLLTGFVACICLFTWLFYRLIARFASRRAFKKVFHTEWPTA